MKFIVRPERKHELGYCYCSKDCDYTQKCTVECSSKACSFCGAVI